MRLEALFEFATGSLVDHLRRRLHDLTFSVINIAEHMHEEVVECLDVAQKKPISGHLP